MAQRTSRATPRAQGLPIHLFVCAYKTSASGEQKPQKIERVPPVPARGSINTTETVRDKQRLIRSYIPVKVVPEQAGVFRYHFPHRHLTPTTGPPANRMGYHRVVDTIGWLLDSDPALRWQAMRDLTDAPAAAIASERARVPCEGNGAELLSLQQPDGSWRRDDAPAWLTTLFSMQLL